jgi:senataxin
MYSAANNFSLSTLHREYAALMSLPYYDLAEPILHPQLSKNSNVDPKEVQQTMLAYSVNEPQAVAISSSLRTEGFALIQGYELLIQFFDSPFAHKY